jgi:hypothetical protein
MLVKTCGFNFKAGIFAVMAVFALKWALYAVFGSVCSVSSLSLIKGLMITHTIPKKVRIAKVTIIIKKGCSIITSPHIIW